MIIPQVSYNTVTSKEHAMIFNSVEEVKIV